MRKYAVTDVQFFNFRNLCDSAHVSNSQSVTCGHMQPVLRRQGRAFAQTSELMIGACGSFAVNSARPERRFCIRSGAQLNLLCVQFAGGFDLKWIGIDEKARHDTRLTQTTYRGADYCDIRAHIQTAFSSYLAGILADQRY